MVKRTKKIFKPYNSYQDRPFGLKWGTAFAMDELVKGIKQNEHEATHEHQALREMSRHEIDLILLDSYLYHRKVILQLHKKDVWGRFLAPVEGFFYGEAYPDYFLLNNTIILWSDVRHITLVKEKKWSSVSIFEKKRILQKMNQLSEIERIDTGFSDSFYPDD